MRCGGQSVRRVFGIFMCVGIAPMDVMWMFASAQESRSLNWFKLKWRCVLREWLNENCSPSPVNVECFNNSNSFVEQIVKVDLPIHIYVQIEFSCGKSFVIHFGDLFLNQKFCFFFSSYFLAFARSALDTSLVRWVRSVRHIHTFKICCRAKFY